MEELGGFTGGGSGGGTTKKFGESQAHTTIGHDGAISFGDGASLGTVAILALAAVSILTLLISIALFTRR